MGGYRKFLEIMYTLPAKSSIRSEFKYFEILKILKKINYMKEVKNIFCKITMPKSYKQITKKKTVPIFISNEFIDFLESLNLLIFYVSENFEK